MGILDSFRKKKVPAADDDEERHHVDALDYFEEKDRDFVHCPECAKERKHVHLMETEGENMECPECHFLREMRRV